MAFRMISLHKWAIALILASLTSSACDAQVELAKQHVLGFRTKSERTTFAKSLRDYYQILDDNIPNPSPKEEEWLKNEEQRVEKLVSTAIANGEDHFSPSFSARRQLKKTKEWNRREAKAKIRKLKKTLTEIIALKNETSEIAAWVDLAKSHLSGEHPFEEVQVIFEKPDHNQAYLRLGLFPPEGYYLPERLRPKLAVLYDLGFEYDVNIAKQILGDIVYPYLFMKGSKEISQGTEK